jgi:hypothetical protein
MPGRLPPWFAYPLYVGAGLAVVALVAAVIQMRVELAVIREKVRNIEATVARIESRQTGKQAATVASDYSVAFIRGE